MVPELILKLVDLLAYWLICRWSGHKPEPWFPATGPEETEARLCSRCLRSQHKHLGVSGPWVK